jgi:hypothetical protein
MRRIFAVSGPFHGAKRTENDSKTVQFRTNFFVRGTWYPPAGDLWWSIMRRIFAVSGPFHGAKRTENACGYGGGLMSWRALMKASLKAIPGRSEGGNAAYFSI